jgi:hypothetical protein
MGKEENPLVTKTPGPSPGRIRTHLYDMHRLEACLHLASYQLTMDYVSMFRVLPPASPPPFVVSRFGGEELLPGTLDTMRGS